MSAVPMVEAAAWDAYHRRLTSTVVLGYYALAKGERNDFFIWTMKRYWRELTARRSDIAAEKRVEMTVAFGKAVVAQLNALASSDGTIGTA